MGTIRFEHRRDIPDSKRKCPLRLIYQLHGKRKYLPLRETLYPENWDFKSQSAIYLNKKEAKKLLPGIDYDLLPTSKEINSLNTTLQAFKKEVANVEDLFTLNKTPYSAQMVIDALKSNRSLITKKDEPSNYLFDFIDKYIEDNKVSREPGSLSVYKALKSHLQNFQKKKHEKVRFENIDYSFFSSFKNFLISYKSKKLPEGLSNTTIAKQLSTLKTFLNYAQMHGVIINQRYKDFKITKETLDVIALTENEFLQLFNYDLSDNKRLDHVRDVFCFGCTTGLRYSDLAQLKREHIKTDEIQLTVTKTKQPLVIPLTPYSLSILNKYTSNMRPLPVVTNSKMNLYVKELCKKVGINEPTQIVRWNGHKRIEKTFPKYELVSVHTSRKSFASISLTKGMSAEEVMKIGGWRNYSSFSRYVKITDQRSKAVMSKAWGDISITKLKAV